MKTKQPLAFFTGPLISAGRGLRQAEAGITFQGIPMLD